MTASSVVEISYTDNRRAGLGLPEASGVLSSIKGEALAVELSPHRVLFVLLGDAAGHDTPADWPGSVWAGTPPSFDATIARMNAEVDGLPQPLPTDYWPQMVTFDDLQKPETLRPIAGTDLSAWFGPGVHLEGIFVQLTSEPISEGRISGLLPWLMAAGQQRGLVAPARPSPCRSPYFSA